MAPVIALSAREDLDLLNSFLEWFVRSAISDDRKSGQSILFGSTQILILQRKCNTKSSFSLKIVRFSPYTRLMLNTLFVAVHLTKRPNGNGFIITLSIAFGVLLTIKSSYKKSIFCNLIFIVFFYFVFVFFYFLLFLYIFNWFAFVFLIIYYIIY